MSLDQTIQYAETNAQLNIEGTQIRPWQTVITRERQAAYLAASDLDPEVYGDRVDASVLANDSILATRYLKSSAQDGLHSGQRLQQFQPLNFDEPLTLNGHIAQARKISKGNLLTMRFEVVRPNGEVAVVTDIISLRIDYEAMKKQGGGGKTALSTDGFDVLSEKPMSPEKVAAYSFEFPDYLVHFDPDVAASMGLRAPLAQGAMSLTWIAGEIAKGGPVQELDLSVSFRAPIFWDDHVRVMSDGGDQFLVANQDGAVCSTGELQSLVRAG